MQMGQRQLAGVRVGVQKPEVGDDQARTAAGQPQPTAVGRSVAEAHRRPEVEPVDEAPPVVAHHDDHLAARGGDLRCASGSGQPDVRFVVVADHGGVEIGQPVDLGRSQEADVDPARLEPVVEDLGDRDDGIRGVRQLAVTDRQRKPGRLGPDGAGLVDEHQPG